MAGAENRRVFPIKVYGLRSLSHDTPIQGGEKYPPGTQKEFLDMMKRQLIASAAAFLFSRRPSVETTLQTADS